MNKGKVFCGCLNGQCFLEKDAKWAKQNYAQALHPNGLFLDRVLLDTLDTERLEEKSKWMHFLMVKGTYQICCTHSDRKLL